VNGVLLPILFTPLLVCIFFLVLFFYFALPSPVLFVSECFWHLWVALCDSFVHCHPVSCLTSWTPDFLDNLDALSYNAIKLVCFLIPLIIFQPPFSLLYCPHSHFPSFWKCPWKKSAAKPKSTTTTPGHGRPLTRSKVVKSKEFNEVDEVLVFEFPCNVLFTPC
jgi:hypothetical protein